MDMHQLYLADPLIEFITCEEQIKKQIASSDQSKRVVLLKELLEREGLGLIAVPRLRSNPKRYPASSQPTDQIRLFTAALIHPSAESLGSPRSSDPCGDREDAHANLPGTHPVFDSPETLRDTRASACRPASTHNKGSTCCYYMPRPRARLVTGAGFLTITF